MQINAHDGNGLVDLEQLARGERLHVQRWVMAPGVSEGAHAHGPDGVDGVGEEAYYVLSGAVTIEHDGQRTVLGEGQSLMLAPEVTRSVINDSDADATILVVFAVEQYD